MKRKLLNVFLAATALFGISIPSSAQIKAPTFTDNWAIDHVSAKFAVTAPTGIAGVKKFTISNDGSGLSNQWGGAITTTYVNVPVVKAYDTLGLNDPLVNGTGSFPALTGKFALIFRGGNVDFSKKAKLCQDKGAVGCIIVNNITGDPVGMGAGSSATGVTIPVIMVSDVVGLAMNTQLRSNVVVTISLSQWGFNYAHDLGILSDGLSLPPNYAMPASQLATGNGNPVAYQGQTGAYIANFGTNSETNVKLVSTVNWTPTGGAASVYRKDSVTIPTFAKSDSILVASVPQAYDFHAATTGKFDINYALSMTAGDSSTGDNTASAVMYVTDSLFCKSRYDFAKGAPVSVLATAPSGSNYIWGPLYNTVTAGHTIDSVQFGVALSGIQPLGAVAAPVNILIYKWDDISAPTSIMTGDELTLVGYGSYSFTDNDTSFDMVTVGITNVENIGLKLRTQANSTYWVAAQVPVSTLLCVDGSLQYVPRVFVRSRSTSVPPVIDLYAPQFTGDEVDLETTGPLVRPIFLEAYSQTGNFPDSVRYTVQNRGYTPSIAMKISKGIPTSVASNTKAPFKVNLYPNPAKDVLNFNIKLENKTNKLFVTVADALGRVISRETKENVKEGTFSVNTNTLASGQYYLILNADQGTTVEKFTILK